MLMSIQQKYILEVLHKLGCVRRTQLLMLVREKFRRPDLVVTKQRLDAMLQQMRHMTADVRLDGEFVFLHGKMPDTRMLEAVDVMLELTEGTLRDFFRVEWQKPKLLYFFYGAERLSSVTVAHLTDTYALDLSVVYDDTRGRVVWISDTGEPPNTLILPAGHFFAMRLPDGKHRFFGSSEP